MGINFGGYSFTEPEALRWFVPPKVSALYAILIPDGAYNPKPFCPIYFGESENLSGRGLPWNHHKSDDWVRRAGKREHLYVSFLLASFWTDKERKQIEQVLIGTYKPVCNDLLPKLFKDFFASTGIKGR